MTHNLHFSRRSLLKAGLAGIAAPSLGAARAASGKPKVLALMGDYWHNPVALERDVRTIFNSADWEITFCQASRFFTPEAIAAADMIFLLRYGGPDSLGWSPEGKITERNDGDPFMTPEQEDALVTNIRERGMGLVAFHAAFWNQPAKFTGMLGVEPVMHREIQPVILRDFNQNHVITRGIKEFYVNLDEQFAAIMLAKDYVPLFMTQAVHDKRDALGGWCFEYGKGRVVALLPGHTQFPWRHPQYQEIVWRSGHWALGKDIPAFGTK